jgi:hypothetical protein
MNAVEIDVGNLWLWLQGVGPYAGGSGPSVSITNQQGTNENGYILYFSDHRGMLPDAHPLTAFYNGISGMSGLNNTVNSASSTGVPDGVLEPATYYAYSPEDVAEKENGFVDNWGQANLGAGFGIAAGTMSQPYYISGTTAGIAGCSTKGEWNMVTGPRHVVRLVDAGMSSGAVSFLPPTSGNQRPRETASPSRRRSRFMYMATTIPAPTIPSGRAEPIPLLHIPRLRSSPTQLRCSQTPRQGPRSQPRI